MGTEKYLGNKRLCFDMDEGESLDYKVSSVVGNSRFDLYVGLIVQNGENKKYKSDDAGNTEIKRMNDFLKNHAGLTYQEFVDQSTPENLDTDSYKLLNRGSIKRSLFETRSKVYLLALCDYEEQGGDIGKILEDIRLKKIPFVKKSAGTEPTFEALYGVLR